MHPTSGSSVTATTLNGLRVLVTRPPQQADKLCRLIENLSGTAVRFPVIEIKQHEQPQEAKKILAELKQYQLAIFISSNAVEHTLRLSNRQQLNALQSLSLISIGTATTEYLHSRLAEHNRQATPSIITNSGNDSLSMLLLPDLQTDKIKGRKIIIFRGQNGNELLAEKLRERGATVDHATVYRRVIPQHKKTFINKIWTEHTPHLIIITSNNSLENLFFLLNQRQQHLLLDKQLVIIGKRMLEHTMKFGFTQRPLIATQSSDQGIIDSIIDWAEHRSKH